MTIRRSIQLLVAALCFTALPTASFALLPTHGATLDSLSDAELEALGTLALADERMRDAILEASLHPRAVERIASISRDSSDQFRERMEALPRSKQKEIWELVRYPELIDALVDGGRPSRGAIDDIVAPYPENIREIARNTVRNDFNLLNDIAHMRSDAERETSKLIATLPLTAQANFEALIDRPDLMTALADHPAVLHQLGASYRDDPFATREAFDRYHEEETERNEAALAEWRDAIEDDPEAQAELVESAEEFAEEEGYDSPRESGHVVERTEVHHYHHPYPYWFGTPYWHASHHWYPHRAHWGFGFDLGGAFFVFGLPTHYYASWHHRAPSRRHHYRHLDRHFRHHKARHHTYSRSRLREHARKHKRDYYGDRYRSRDGKRRHRDIRVADYRNSGRDRTMRHRRDRDDRGLRSRIGYRDADRDVQPRKKRKSKFREATERAKRRVRDEDSIRTRKGTRGTDRRDRVDRRTRSDRGDDRLRARQPERDKKRVSSRSYKKKEKSKGIRSKARRDSGTKIAKRSSKSPSIKRNKGKSIRSKARSSEHSKKAKSRLKRSKKSKSKKKGGNGGRNFARR